MRYPSRNHFIRSTHFLWHPPLLTHYRGPSLQIIILGTSTSLFPQGPEKLALFCSLVYSVAIVSPALLSLFSAIQNPSIEGFFLTIASCDLLRNRL